MIGIIGINHNTASVDIRECYALSESEAFSLVEEWKANRDVEGAIVLSTCNRIEIYYETAEQHFRPYILIQKLASFKQIENLDENIFLCKQGTEAFKHLFRLASGLESMVRGETQILGQLKSAFRNATEHKHSTSILSRMFHKAFETAKLIRTSYFVSSIPISSGAAAVHLLLEKVTLPRLSVLIVGAGQIAETVCDELRRIECPNIRIYNRTRERAERFAATHGNLDCYYEDQLREALQEADVVFVATSSLTPIIVPELLVEKDPQKPLYLFDMAVPRNVSEEIADLPFCSVFTIDDLKRSSSEAVLEEIDWQSIENLIEEMASQLEEWVNASALREVIHTIQEASDLLLQKELSKLPNDLDEYDKRKIAHYEQHLRVSFSTALVAASRKVTQEGRNLKYAEAIGNLFKVIIDNHL